MVSDLLRTSECLARNFTHTHTHKHIRAPFLFISFFLFSCWSSYTQEPLQVLAVLAYSYCVKVRMWVTSHIGGWSSIDQWGVKYSLYGFLLWDGWPWIIYRWMFEVPLPEWINTGFAATSSSNSSAITSHQKMNTWSCCHTVVTGLRSTSLSLPLLAESTLKPRLVWSVVVDENASCFIY